MAINTVRDASRPKIAAEQRLDQAYYLGRKLARAE
jgi:hypothetical protein